MIRLICFFIVSLLTFSADATITGYKFTYTSFSEAAGVCHASSDATGACTSSAANSYYSAGGYTFTTLQNNGTACGIHKTGYSDGYVNLATCDATCASGQGRSNGVCGACPAGQSQQSNGSCGCPAGQDYYGGACVASCTTNTQDFAFNTAAGTALNLGSANQCVGQCGYTITDIIPLDATGNNCSTNAAGTVKTCYFTGTGTGSHCSGTSTAVSSNTAQTTGVKVTTATDASGNVTKTTTTTTVNANGTTTTTIQIQVTPAGGSTTTTTSTVVGSATGTATGNGSGSGTGTGTGSGSSGTGAGQCDPTANNYEACIAGNQTGVNHTTSNASTFADALTNFQTSMKATPLGGLASTSGIGGTITVGSCPSPTFTFFGRSMQMTAHCTIWDGIKDQVAPIMHVVYIAVGILILLSA